MVVGMSAELLAPPVLGAADPMPAVEVRTRRVGVAEVTAAWLAARRSPHTRRAYHGDLAAWSRWCAVHHLDPLAVRRRHVQVWGAQLSAQGMAPASVARRLAAVSAWYRVLAGEDLIDLVPTVDLGRPVVNVDDSAVLGMDQAAAAQLLRTAQADGPRSHALVALLLLRALRISEALALDAPDVSDTLRGHRIARVAGKGGRTRVAAMPPAVTRAVDTLLDGRTEGPVFRTRTGARWQPSGAYRVVRRLARDAAVPNFARVHPHALRHTAVTLALDSGANLVDVQDMAGHSDPRTTRRYDRARGRLDRDPSSTGDRADGAVRGLRPGLRRRAADRLDPGVDAGTIPPYRRGADRCRTASHMPGDRRSGQHDYRHRTARAVEAQSGHRQRAIPAATVWAHRGRADRDRRKARRGAAQPCQKLHSPMFW